MDTVAQSQTSAVRRGLAALRRACLFAALIGGGVIAWVPTPLAAASQPMRLANMPLPTGLTPVSPPERFGPRTLFEIIDGEADLFLKAGFVDLETRTFHLDGDPERWIDLFVYQMEGHRSAFAVFSTKRGPEALPAALTPFSYRYPEGLYFVHGPYYVEVHAAREAPPLGAAMNELAEIIIASYAVSETAIPELALFPEADQVSHSVALHTAGALGFEGFADLFTARYRVQGRGATAFFRICPTPEAATRLAADYRSFLVSYGAERPSAVDGLPNGFTVRVLDSYTLVFTAGRAVGGVQEAADPDAAAALARRLYERLASSGH